MNRVKKVVDDILKFGYVRYGGLGVVTQPNSSSYLTSERFKAAMQKDVGAVPPAGGILVRSVSVGSVAEKAGITQFDVLLEIDGAKLVDDIDLNKALLPKKPGDQIKLKLWHRGTVKELNLTLQELRG